MFRSAASLRRRFATGVASKFALSIALAAGAVTGSAMLPASAQAQDYSRGFTAAYQPVADVVNAEGGDIASVAGQFPAIIAAAQTPDDRFAAGNLILVAGNKTENRQWQRQGLELMVQSGKAPPEQLGQFQWFIGSLAYDAKDYAAARTALQAAQAAGYSDPQADIEGLIAESYFAEGNAAQGVALVLQSARERTAASQTVPERWLLRALQSAYEQNLTSEATEVSTLLVTQYPSERNWMNALQVVGALHDFDAQQQLDLLRLMRETGALSERNEYVRYIEAADPRAMANEVGEVLAAGLAAGQFSADDTYYSEVKGIVDQRASADRQEAPSLVAEAQGASDGAAALEAANVVYSLGDYAQAETMYQMALDKGVADRDTVLTRLGIAQAKQGKHAEAQTTLEQVTGKRAPIAQMWALYAQTRAAG